MQYFYELADGLDGSDCAAQSVTQEGELHYQLEFAVSFLVYFFFTEPFCKWRS